MSVISSRSSGAIEEIYGRKKALIGMIHCPPFPGAPRYKGVSMDEIRDACLFDAERLIGNGMHGLIVENHGDIPFSKPEDMGQETAACLAVITRAIRERFDVPMGINVLAIAPVTAFAAAVASGAGFIRVSQWANAYLANEGLMEGRAAEAMRYRAALRADHAKVFADAHVTHGAHAITSDRSIVELTRDLAFLEADAVIATGQRTGNSATREETTEIAGATHLPLLVGSGVTEGKVGEILGLTDGVIVASSHKQDGVWWNPVEDARVKRFVARASEALDA